MTEGSPPPPVEEIAAAGFPIRAGARIIDLVYGLVLGFVGGIAAGICIGILSQQGVLAPGWEQRIQTFNFIGFGLGLLGSLFYQALAEGLYGASLGKLICQLRVVTEDLKPITMGQAFKRNIAYWWDALFFGLVAYSRMKNSDLQQRYGDAWAHTLVLKSAAVPADTRQGFELFVLAFLMGSVVILAFDAISLVLHAM